MENVTVKGILPLAREVLKGEEDALFKYGGTKPEASAMESLSKDEAEFVNSALDSLLENTRRHKQFMRDLVDHLEGRKGGGQ